MVFICTTIKQTLERFSLLKVTSYDAENVYKQTQGTNKVNKHIPKNQWQLAGKFFVQVSKAVVR